MSMGSFEMQRMLRQNAHEKAFEIRVQGQRRFEKQRNNMIREGKERHEAEHKERVKKLQIDLNISRSQAVNQARLLKMKVREDYMQLMRSEMLDDLRKLRTDDRDRYLNTVKNLVLQTMIRLLEEEVHVLCRDEDKADLIGLTSEIEEQYSTFMNEKTGREYSCTINII